MRTGAAALVVLLAPTAATAQTRPPIIDMHLHAEPLEAFVGGGPLCTSDQPIVFPGWDPRTPLTLPDAVTCPAPIRSPATDDEVMRQSLAMLDRYNIWAVTAGPADRVAAWSRAARGRIIRAAAFSEATTPAAEYRRRFEAGEFAVFAEITAQYRGLRLDDPSYDPYFALAEELDIPVGVHLGEGPPGGAHLMGGPAESPYRAALTSPLQLEGVLVRHPKLRLYVMHYGSPLVDEMIALLYSHPQVYVDIAQNDWGFPRAHFYGQLRRLIDAGFEQRIMWGSDQMVWPDAIPAAIRTIEEAPFLSEAQKRAIFYDNAARFLRLSAAEIARHHGR
ncbi:MAG: amidohydrolase family protein [Gemmatimonadales bacterium]